MDISRRDFLKITGTGALALSAVPLLDQAALAKYLTDSEGLEPVGILVDTTRCIGCRSCQQACKKKNNLPADSSAQMPYGRTWPEQISASTFTIVEFHDINAELQTTGGTAQPYTPRAQVRPVKRQCMHCLEPACVSVCPVAAITKHPRGPVVYDADKCLGCRYCVAACPFEIPKFEWDSGNPRIRKCNMCVDLVAKGEKPACVQACPVQALTSGPRGQLIAEAQARVGAAPDKYVPYIYGLSEVGGTSVLYLANVAMDKLGFRTDLPKNPLPEYTGQVMEKVPAVAVGVGLLMGAVSWWNHRREQIAKTNQTRS